MRLSRNNFFILCFEFLLLAAVIYIPHQYAPQAYIVVANIFVVLTIIRIIKEGFRDVPLFFFNITYWIFVLGGCTVSLIQRRSISEYIAVSLTNDQLVLSCGIALFGIASLDIIYYFFKIERSSSDICGADSRGATKFQKQFIVLIFLVSSICKLAMAVEIMMYSTEFGYVSLYTREASNLPSLIRYLGAFFYFSLMLFLSCNFSKRATYMAFGLVGMIEVIILSSGDRGEAVCGILVLIIYTIFRCRKSPDFLVHKKLAVFILLCFLPAFVFLLQAIKYIRVGNTADISFWNGVFEFFESQGVSINIIANDIKYQNEISEIGGHTFVFNQIVSYLQQNILFRTIFGFKKIAGNTIEMATSGFSLGSTIMYITLPDSYFRGIGCGTCYLAELYQDAKWFGLMIGTIIVARLLDWIRKIDQEKWVMSAMMLNCMRIVLVLPRGGFFRWLTEMLSIPNMILLLAIYTLGYFPKRRK